MSEINGLNDLTYGLYIVSSSYGETKGALVVNTAFQVTADPAELAVCINKKSFTHELVKASGTFAVMPLEEKTPFVFIGRFGFRTSRTFNKFENVEFSVGKNNCPLIKKYTLAAIEVCVVKSVDLPTHTLFIGKVTDTHVFNASGKPLTYEYYHTVLKGKTPEGATHR